MDRNEHCRDRLGDEMIRLKASTIALVSLGLSQQTAAQEVQPDVQIIAQAHDRCMATQAVRLTHTIASDRQIYSEATQSCLSLNDRLRAEIGAQLPPAQAAELLRAMNVQAEPNFLAMVARIRSDRARRAGQ